MSVSSEYYSLFLFDSDGKIIPYENECFLLQHGQRYKVGIYNHSIGKRINAAIEIDGKKIGKFRVNSNSYIKIERPTHVSRKLTFYAADSEEGRMAGLKLNYVANIIVSIETEKVSNKFECDGGNDDLEVDGCGGTGLSDVSSQSFYNCSDIQIEQNNVVVLMAKMKLAPRIIPL